MSDPKDKPVFDEDDYMEDEFYDEIYDDGENYDYDYYAEGWAYY